MRKISLLVSSFISIFFLVGCQSLNIDNMNADYQGIPMKQSHKSIFVSDVSYTGETLKGDMNGFEMKKIDVFIFKNALVKSLIESNLFEQVELIGSKSDFTLNSEIISQGQKINIEDASYRSAIIVKYQLVDNKQGKEVWKNRIVSSGKGTFNDSMNGSVRANMSIEKAVSINLTLLLGKISETATLYQ